MKKLLILSVLTALTGASVGCCGMGGCFGRRDNCAPAYDECGPAPCNDCGAPMGAPMGAPVISSPGMVTPGPAYSARYLPR